MGGRGERLLQAEEVGSFALRNAKSQLGGSTKKKILVLLRSQGFMNLGTGSYGISETKSE